MSATNFSTIRYSIPEAGIARITLDRPDKANAQDTKMLYELNAAFDLAAHDDDIKVIMLDANGKHFSSGHDLGEPDMYGIMKDFDTVAPLCGFNCGGAERHMSREEEIYLGFCERWRNIPKPTIAVVHGKCVAGGLMLAWPCDLIIASEDAIFCDPTVSFGIGGIEYFTHVWEVGGRKAREMLFTSDEYSAEEARQLGMVNKVVPREALAEEALIMARKITKKSRFALKVTKKAILGAEDAQGRKVAMENAFHLHQLAHTHWLTQYDYLMDPTGLPKATQKAIGFDDAKIAAMASKASKAK